LNIAYPPTEEISVALGSAYVIDSADTGFYQVELVTGSYVWVNQGEVAQEPLQVKSYGLAEITLQAGQANPNGTVTISQTATEALMMSVASLELICGDLQDLLDGIYELPQIT